MSLTPFTASFFFLVSVNDVYAACDKLEAAGCSFKKKPDEGKLSRRFAVSILKIYGIFGSLNSFGNGDYHLF
jgi:hypothetical protein